MAASRSMLEALLARVQKRAAEPRTSAVFSPASELAEVEELEAEADDARTLPPPRAELTDEDIEDYDDELIEIIDDAEVIPQAAAAARAIDARALVSNLDRRSGFGAAAAHGSAQSSAPKPAAAAPPSTRAAVVRSSEPANDALRAESVAPRPVAPTEVASSRGVRRELRATSFIELLDASLKLGG
jgi:hypothetical protein